MTIAEIATLKRKSIIGAFSYFARSLLLQGIGFVAAVILSSYFSPEDFGIYGIVLSIIGILIFFSDVGLASTLIQKKQEPTLEELRSVFTVQFLLSLVIFLICIAVAASGLLAQKTGVVGNYILLVLGLSFPLATLKTIPSILLERELLFSKLVIPMLFEQIVFHVILVYLAVAHWGAMAYVPAILARSISGVVVLYCIRRWKIGFSNNWQVLRGLIGFGVKFQLNDFLARIKDQLFYLVVGVVLPLKENGYVQWAKTWSMYPYNLTVNNVMAITFPTYSRLQEHPQQLQRAIEKSLFFITLAIFPILCGMVLFISPLIELFPTYAKWQPAIPSFIFFTLSIAWSSISSPLTTTLSAIGQINYTLKLMVMWTLLTWIVSPLLFLWMGFDGIAVAAFIISSSSYLSVKFVQKFVKVRVWDSVWRQLLAATVMGIFGLLTLSFWALSLSSLFLGMVLSGFVYLGILFLVGKKELLSQISSLRTV